ncbi:hypothetical protein [Flocculibacter collagenilyticus]|uniref:hypothetical protein n=1 Tax=Flocculibacter collagenilyticus TaxID=2744479 RepID=UPI0018F54936|nr:hypothetical protein [Flocculibacter collagenilyticus]
MLILLIGIVAIISSLSVRNKGLVTLCLLSEATNKSEFAERQANDTVEGDTE